jgi:hypothetical protein
MIGQGGARDTRGGPPPSDLMAEILEEVAYEEGMHTDGSDDEEDDFDEEEDHEHRMDAAVDEMERGGNMFPWHAPGAADAGEAMEAQAERAPGEEPPRAAHAVLRVDMERRNFRVLNLRGQLGGLCGASSRSLSPYCTRLLLP